MKAILLLIITAAVLAELAAGPASIGHAVQAAVVLAVVVVGVHWFMRAAMAILGCD